jgi:hypothetical protein
MGKGFASGLIFGLEIFPFDHDMLDFPSCCRARVPGLACFLAGKVADQVQKNVWAGGACELVGFTGRAPDLLAFRGSGQCVLAPGALWAVFN